MAISDTARAARDDESISDSSAGTTTASVSAALQEATHSQFVLSKQLLGFLQPFVAFIEAIVFASVSFLMAVIFVENLDQRSREYFIVTVLTVTALITVLHLSRLYTMRALSNPGPRIPRLLGVFGGLLLGLVTVFFALKVSSEFSRAWLFSWFLVSSMTAVTFRAVLGRLLYRWADRGRLARQVIILGAGERGRALLSEIARQKVPQIRVVGFFDDRVERYGDSIEGVPLLGKVSDLIVYLRDSPDAEIMITLPWSATDRIQDFTRQLGMLPVDVNLIPESVVSDFQAVRFGRLGGVPILQVSRRAISGWKLVFKWLEDRVLGGIITLLAAPLMIVIAVAVKLTSPGPVFFRQARYGFNNKLMSIYKFRTMYTHLTDSNAERLTSKDDARVTPFGRFLRKTSLDELPQLLNVLNGEMSLVGPRPHAMAAKAADRLYEEVSGDYGARHRVKPGITGWAQVHGWRGETDTYEKLIKRIEYDLYYIENFSLWLDFQILLKTLYVVLWERNNAY